MNDNYTQSNSEVFITGLDRELSIYSIPYHIECFSKLVFDLSKQPEKEWIDVYLNEAKKYRTKGIREKFSFEGTKLTISDAEVNISDLQDYIDDLKNSINIANELIKSKIERDQRRINDFNSTLDDLCF